MSAGTLGYPPRTVETLERLRLEFDEAWQRHCAGSSGNDERALASAVAADPGAHDWRLVDAALERLRCPDCGARLGAGPRGCATCDAADGSRFAAREPDPPGVPPGTQHATRVSSAILRMPHRYPAYAVRGNALLLPLFMAGQLPRREEKARLDRLLKTRAAADPRLESAETFDAFLVIAAEGGAAGSPSSARSSGPQRRSATRSPSA